mgnify:CR=1 FL=1
MVIEGNLNKRNRKKEIEQSKESYKLFIVLWNNTCKFRFFCPILDFLSLQI